MEKMGTEKYSSIVEKYEKMKQRMENRKLGIFDGDVTSIDLNGVDLRDMLQYSDLHHAMNLPYGENVSTAKGNLEMKFRR